MGRRVTLKDVAARAGVSYQTVSKVLNGKASVGAETEARIWRAVDHLGYRTNVTARNLRVQATRLIGYSWTPVRADQVNPILDKFLSSVVASAEAAGYHVLLFPTPRGDEAGEPYRELIASGRVDGFILSTTNYDDPRIRTLREMAFPFVTFGRTNPEWEFPYVDVDGRAGVRAATRHLAEQGHRRIALLAWPPESRSGTARYNGYVEAMEEAGLPIVPSFVRRGPGHFDQGYQATREWLQGEPEQRPSAVVAVDDQLAIGALRAAQTAGLQVGPDFGVTGFDDTPGVHLLAPPLTSVRQPIQAVGQRIVTLLVDLLQGRTPTASQILLQPELIVRQSSLRTPDANKH